LTAPDADPTVVPDGPLPGFDGLYGLEVLTATAEEVSGRIRIDDRHLQPFGIVHGGVYAAAAESLASTGTFLGTGGEKFVAGLSNVTSFLRPVFAGDTVSAVAVPRHRGRTTWVWEVDLRDGEGRTCALVRVTIAVREAEGERALPGTR
jgi:1,4-dihydroxy-2-naphthoyl-CoA hydrolase